MPTIQGINEEAVAQPRRIENVQNGRFLMVHVNMNSDELASFFDRLATKA
jgi:hypothetical protein